MAWCPIPGRVGVIQRAGIAEHCVWRDGYERWGGGWALKYRGCRKWLFSCLVLTFRPLAPRSSRLCSFAPLGILPFRKPEAENCTCVWGMVNVGILFHKHLEASSPKIKQSEAGNADSVFLEVDGGIVVVVQLLSHVQLSATPGTAACQASLSFISRRLLQLVSTELVMPSNLL